MRPAGQGGGVGAGRGDSRSGPGVGPIGAARAWLHSCVAAFGFLTVFGSPVVPSPESLSWFPFVGAILGCALGSLWWAAGRVLPATVAAAVVVVADLALTGMLHFDGLCDSADGLLGHMDAGRRLEVMREPGVGAWGVAAGASMLGLRWVALASLQPSLLLVAGLWCMSRSVMALAAVSLPYARSDGGLLSVFRASEPSSGSRDVPVVLPSPPSPPAATLMTRMALCVPGIAGAVVLLEAWRPVHGVEVLAACAVSGVAVVMRARRAIGGVTGDVLGAMGVVLETVGLVAATLR